MEYYSGLVRKLKENEVFVFGSNPEGRHGAGAAKIAKDNYGAIYGKGRGIQGNSYGLITKNLKSGYVEKSTNIMYPLSGEKSVLEYQILDNIKELYEYSKLNPQKRFLIAYTNNRYNLNGYSPTKMFEMFYQACNGIFPVNIIFSDSFMNLYQKLNKKFKNHNFKVIVINIKELSLEIKANGNYIYCGDGSVLANPFRMSDHAITDYSQYINKTLKDMDKRNKLNEIWKIGKEYGEVFLGCDCVYQQCHCDIIKEIIENKQSEFNKN